MWDLPGPVIEPMFHAMADRFFTTELPAKPSISLFNHYTKLENLRLCIDKVRFVVEILNATAFQRRRLSFCVGIIKDIFY